MPEAWLFVDDAVRSGPVDTEVHDGWTLDCDETHGGGQVHFAVLLVVDELKVELETVVAHSRPDQVVSFTCDSKRCEWLLEC